MYILASVYGPRCIGALVHAESGDVDWFENRAEFSDQEVPDMFALRPFGITWSDEELYLANNWQILVYDRSLNYQRMMPRALHPNVHQILFRQGRIWGVSPWTNTLISVNPSSREDRLEFEFLTGKIHRGEPLIATADGDKAHFNSLYWDEERLLVAAHNFGHESFIIEYDPLTFDVRGIRHDTGRMIHSLAADGDDTFWISTGTCEIRSAQGYQLRLKRDEFARGFAMTEDHFIVGFSTRAQRQKRRGNDSWIHVIDRRNGSVLEEFHLCETGDINDLRILDAPDFAHNVQPFWESAISAERAVAAAR